MSIQDKNIKIAQVLDQALNAVKSIAGYPLELTRQVNEDFRGLERDVNVLARASGMSDQTYNNIVSGLTHKAAGTIIEVLQMMKSVFETLGNTVNFQDPTNVNAIFGGIDRVNENEGKIGLQKWLKDQLLPIIQKTKDAGINPKQLTSLIDNSVNSTIGASQSIKYIDRSTNQEVPFCEVIQLSDGKFVNKNTGMDVEQKITLIDTGKNQEDIMRMEQSMLGNTAKSAEEFLGWKGDALKNSMEFGQDLRRTITPITMTPDDQQRMRALTQRELTGLEEAKLRNILGLEQGMAPGVLLALEDARSSLDTGADVIQPFARTLDIVPQTTTYVSTGAEAVKDILDPSKLLKPQSQGKTAGKKRKLVKIAQIEPQSTYTFTTPQPGTPTDEFRPQPISGVAGWQQDVAQADITTEGAAKARELELANLIGQKLAGEIMETEKKTNMLSQHLEQFQAGLGPVQDLKRQGVTDETIIKQVKPLMVELIDQYDQLIKLYSFGIQQINTKLLLAERGDPQLQGQVSQLKGFAAEFNEKVQTIVYQQKTLIVDLPSIEQRMQQKLQETVVSDTLKQLSDFYEQAYGSSAARGEYAASQAQEARYLDDAAKSTGANVSPVMRARLRQKALEKMNQSLQTLNQASQKPNTPDDQTVQMIGI